MSAALDDVVVLDLTESYCASLSAAFLADFGARVIRVECLGAAGKNNVFDSDGWNYEADLIHRNKQSVALDFRTDEGREILLKMVARADVILTDWQVSDLTALQLDYQAVSKDNPGIIFARISGFGPEGPDRDLPAIDELAAARTGMMPIVQQPGQPPVYTGAGKMHASVMLGFGVVTALIHRQATGEGQQVDTSLFAANMYGASLDLQAFLAINEDDPQRDRLLHPISRLDVSNPISGALYPSADGRWVTLTMPDTDRWWPLLAPAVGIDVDDERFDSHEKRCVTNRLALIEELELGFAKHPGSYWRQLFSEQGMSADVIEQFDFPAEDPQARVNRYILDLKHPSYGEIKTLGFPIYMSDSPAQLVSLAPCIGQHSQMILHELLGYSEDAICKFSSDGIIA